MKLSYANLPAFLCPECKGNHFARIGRELHCSACQPRESADEWLVGEFGNGIRRWQLADPPDVVADPQALMFVAADLTWIVLPIGATTLDLIKWSEEWTRKLDRQFFGWLHGRLLDHKSVLFPEDFDAAMESLREIAAKGFELGVLGQWARDESRWPEDSSWEPFADVSLWDELADLPSSV